MSEPLPLTLKSNSTCSAPKNSKPLCLRKLRSKLAFLLRSFIFLSVVLVFYTKFIITSQVAERDVLKSFHTNNVRHILSYTNLNETFGVADNNLTNISSNKLSLTNCSASAINEFPPDGLTRWQRQHGWIIVHILIAFYSFWFLAAICDDYFVPAIEQLCANLSTQKDVVGATVMAAANSSSELFMNLVGTFVTKGDIGVGTIVGSAVFNILAVPACCGFFIGQFVLLDWWPVTRDRVIYCIAVLALIGTLLDGIVMWYEALCLVIGYFFYLLILYYNDKMARTARKLITKYRRRSPHPFREVNEITPLLWTHSSDKHTSISNLQTVSLQDLLLAEKGENRLLADNTFSEDSVDSNESDSADSPWFRDDRHIFEFTLRWPITFLLWISIPDSRRRPRLKYLTFMLSVVWIGTISYLVAYVITIIGDTLDIPDSVMGLTILAAGMSLPEAVSSIIVTRQGQGAMGISNTLGSNTFVIFLCLGVPWFIKAFFLPENSGEHWVELKSSGLIYTTFILLLTLFCLYIAFVINRFVLDLKIGIACCVMYVGFITIASMIELNFFFDVNLPICQH